MNIETILENDYFTDWDFAMFREGMTEEETLKTFEWKIEEDTGKLDVVSDCFDLNITQGGEDYLLREGVSYQRRLRVWMSLKSQFLYGNKYKAIGEEKPLWLQTGDGLPF